MRKWIVGLFCLTSGLILQACAVSDALKTASVGERNVDNLYRLNLGMDETQVLGIMRDPHSEESFQVEEDLYDVWFYVTTMTVMSQTRMVPMNLTPLTFKNKILVGMGYVYYNWLKVQSEKLKKSKLSPQEYKIEESIEKATSFYAPPKEMLSMSKPEKKSDPPQSETQEKEKPDIKINEKDNQIIEDEQEQNFDFW